MELELGLALSSNWDNEMKKKRCFDETLIELKNVSVDSVPPKTLPLLVWDGFKPNGEDQQKKFDMFSATKRNGREEEVLVGWPPVKSWRKKHYQLARGGTTNYVTVENGGGDGGGGGRRRSNSMFVKVKMEGVGIARKVDLSVHHSYQRLIDTLIAMFGKRKPKS